MSFGFVRSASGHNAVKVRMEAQVLSPGMQDTNHAAFHTLSFEKCLQHTGYFRFGAHCSNSVSNGLNGFKPAHCAMCRYSIAVSMEACPGSFCDVRMSMPSSSKCVAKLCRSVCSQTALRMPARLEVSFTAH